MFVHPTAPLYALTAFAGALVFAPRSPRLVAREAWPGAVALLLTFVPYYVRTLHVLGDRYGVGSGQARGRTFSGRPVWEDALHFVAPGRHDLNYFTVLALIGVVALLVWRRAPERSRSARSPSPLRCSSSRSCRPTATRRCSSTAT